MHTEESNNQDRVAADGDAEQSISQGRRQCCSRDIDRDGNCDIHSEPGVFRNETFN